MEFSSVRCFVSVCLFSFVSGLCVCLLIFYDFFRNRFTNNFSFDDIILQFFCICVCFLLLFRSYVCICSILYFRVEDDENINLFKTQHFIYSLFFVKLKTHSHHCKWNEKKWKNKLSCRQFALAYNRKEVRQDVVPFTLTNSHTQHKRKALREMYATHHTYDIVVSNNRWRLFLFRILK